MIRRLLVLVAALALAAGAAQDGPSYQDPTHPTRERVADLLARMTLEEKVGQMTQIDLARLMGSGEWDRGPLDEVWLDRVLGDAQVGSLLSGGGAAPVPNDPDGWARTVDALQRHALERSRLGIPILYGVDAVHGHNNVAGATIYPHQIGLAASFDAELVREVGAAVARDVAATGITWNFAPVADLGTDPRWGRHYETFGESPVVASELVAAWVDGHRTVPRVATTLKHFVGYGQARNGRDRAPADLSERALRGTHLPPFVTGIRAGARTVMANSGSVNGVPVHASRYLLTDVLRGELGFDGVLLSDWADVDKLVRVHRVAPDLEAAAAMAIDAGIDVVMVPHDAQGFTDALLAAVASGAVPEERIDEAAGRVLALKFELGLFERPFAELDEAGTVVQDDRTLAARAAAAGITLLRNRRSALPLDGVDTVLVTGPGATDVAMQMGGWTIGWQGVPEGDETPPAVTVLDGMLSAAPEGVEVRHVALDDPELAAAAANADAVVVVLGEPPYAEAPGDDAELRLPDDQREGFARLAAGAGSEARLVTVLLAGRPLLLDELLPASDALVMAYLPGTEAGTAVAEVLYGRTSPAGRLPFAWPGGAGELPLPGAPLPSEVPVDPLYPLGHGLTYANVRYEALEAAVEGREVLVSVTVRNDSDVASDEVVLVRADHPVLPVMTPVRGIVGFDRIALEPGETRRVTVRVPLERLAVVPGDVRGDEAPIVAAGSYRFHAGRASGEALLPACQVHLDGTGARCP